MRLSIIRPLRSMRAPSINFNITTPFQQPALQVQRRFCSSNGKWLPEYTKLRDAAKDYTAPGSPSTALYKTIKTYCDLLTATHDKYFEALCKNSTTFEAAAGATPMLKYRGTLAVLFVSNPDRIVLLLSRDCFTPKDPEAVSDDNWFLADFGAVDEKLDPKQINESAQIFKKRLMGLLRGVTFADAIRMKASSEKVSAFPHFVSQDVETVLRPPLTREEVVDGLISCSRHRFDLEDNKIVPVGSLNIFGAMLEGVLQKTIVINGASGSGKTVLALQVAKSLADVYLNGEPKNTERVVLGLYLQPGGRSLGQTESVATEIASKIRTKLNKVFDKLNPKDRSLKNVLLHVVLDEVGSRTDLCKGILTEHVSVCNEIKTRLSETVAVGDAGYEGCAIQDPNGLKISLTLVGTGVAYPGADGSMGLPYWRVSSDTASLQVMRRILNLKFGVSEQGSESAVVNTKEKDPKVLAVQKFVNFVETDRLLSILVGNKRMAAQMAEELLKYEGFKGELRLVSSAVALATVRAYVTANSWSKINDAPQKTHMANLLSLVTTQSHGCHVLSPEDLKTLTTTVGAMEDVLEWRDDTEANQPFEHPVDANVNSDLTETGSEYEHKLLPIVNEEASNGAGGLPMNPYFRTRQPGVDDPNGYLRYHIPPALALMALIRYAELCGVWLFSSDQQNSSVTYEKFTGLILAATLNAFASHNVLEFPAHLLFLRTQGSVNDVLKTQKIKMRSFLQKVPTKRNHIYPVEFDWLGYKDNVVDCLAPLTKPETEFVVEAALPRAAQNDCILYGKGLAIGIESKFYLDEGVVSASVLVKRACQMGYGEVYCEFPCSEALVVIPKATEDVEEHVPKKIKITAPAVPPKATEDAPKKTKYAKLTVTKEVHDFFTSQDSDIIEFKSFKYDKAKRKAMVTIPTEKAAMKSKENRLAMVRSCWLAKCSEAKFGAIKDVVVLSGPSGQTLMPEATTAVFRNPYAIKVWKQPYEKPMIGQSPPWNPNRTYNIKFQFSQRKPSTEADVVTWNLSLEQFLSATSIQPIKDRSAKPSGSVGYECFVDNSTSAAKEETDKKPLFQDKVFYLNAQSEAKKGRPFTTMVPISE